MIDNRIKALANTPHDFIDRYKDTPIHTLLLERRQVAQYIIETGEGAHFEYLIDQLIHIDAQIINNLKL